MSEQVMPDSQATAYINTRALRHNLDRVRQYAPDSRVLVVIKANAYGHGLETVARQLTDADAMAVGSIQEAHELRAIMPDHEIVILQGVTRPEHVEQCVALNLQTVIHSEYQLDYLEQSKINTPLRCWLKIDTGMHRLGIHPDQVSEFIDRCDQSENIASPLMLMSHLACADEPGNAENMMQIEAFEELAGEDASPRSLANSAGLIAFPDACYEWVRPGIMLYGISPQAGVDADDLSLQPVMTLKSRLVAINQLMQGDRIGYGLTWQCPEDMPVGVVGIGYGDGYPRHAPSGTPVLINGREVPVIGRVSMDMITVDLRGLPDAQVGDEVILWGEGLPAEVIAEYSETIAYELLCRLTSRVRFEVV